MSEASSTVELTDAIVRAATCPEGKSEILIRDSRQRGLALRVRASGSKSFCALTTRPGQRGTWRVALGPVGAISIASARKKAAAILGAEGDVIAERRKTKEAAKAVANDRAVTVGALLADDGPYQRHIAGCRVKWRAMLSSVRRGLLPLHKSRNIKALTLLHVTTEMDRLVAAGKQGASDYFRKNANHFLEFVRNKGHTDVNVMAGYKKPRKGYHEAALEKEAREDDGKERTDAEIVAIWNACGELDDFGVKVRFTLLSGCRRSEPEHLMRERDVKDDAVSIPWRYTKCRREHQVVRTALLDEVLEDARRFERDGKLFRKRDWTHWMGKLRRISGVLFCMHDLRKTLMTKLSKLGFPDEVQKLVVGQRVGDSLSKIYNLDPRWSVRQEATAAYHRYISVLLERGDIDALRQREAKRAELLAQLAALDQAA